MSSSAAPKDAAVTATASRNVTGSTAQRNVRRQTYSTTSFRDTGKITRTILKRLLTGRKKSWMTCMNSQQNGSARLKVPTGAEFMHMKSSVPHFQLSPMPIQHMHVRFRLRCIMIAEMIVHCSQTLIPYRRKMLRIRSHGGTTAHRTRNWCSVSRSAASVSIARALKLAARQLQQHL